jgi:hypothetical protein
VSEPKIFLLVGGPADGDKLELCGEPATYDVDGELYLRTILTESAFYRHSSLLPEPAVEEYLSTVKSEEDSPDGKRTSV